MLSPFESLFAQGLHTGTVIVEWLEEPGPDRRMRLQESVSFRDEGGQDWVVPAGWVVDGASIPPVFWNLIGPPFVGDYRRASVVHDYYCDEKSRSWRKVHRMFYHACIASGVSKAKAQSMYAAVYVGGPRWKTIKIKSSPISGNVSPFNVTEFERTLLFTPKTNDKKFAESADWIQDTSLTLEELEKRLDESGIFEVEVTAPDFGPGEILK